MISSSTSFPSTGLKYLSQDLIKQNSHVVRILNNIPTINAITVKLLYIVLPLYENLCLEIKLLPPAKEKYLVYGTQAFGVAFFNCEQMIFSFFYKNNSLTLRRKEIYVKELGGVD